MKTLAASLTALVLLSSAQAGTSMKLEGSCKGKMAGGTPISYTYFSNFDGCKEVSSAAANFHTGREGLATGTRSFTETSDVYKLDGYTLRFANSTGNTTGKLTYKDKYSGRIKTVTLECSIRDYEYNVEC